ncbi:hypothetical protein J2I47_24460 [Fibrella sp. HMF5335]|uniref:Uncharacterized protein n=1 Tax=Fibrella rubiginis TaxID=2817060 RepID=A0A939GNJ3_9BACT|nr:hypothetical protein [Fibrella rubiginis]MBO0939722.1 hypothetical protein [Fibrella rubiginis]
MIERPESEQSPSDKDPKPGTFLKEVDEDTDVDADEINDKSNGMEETDYLGKSNLRNRDIESEEDKP